MSLTCQWRYLWLSFNFRFPVLKSCFWLFFEFLLYLLNQRNKSFSFYLIRKSLQFAWFPFCQKMTVNLMVDDMAFSVSFCYLMTVGVKFESICYYFMRWFWVFCFSSFRLLARDFMFLTYFLVHFMFWILLLYVL